jgi:DNA-binding winged helix-turn-helix (wHTH) protein/predicted Ser/Thr protein kinase
VASEPVKIQESVRFGEDFELDPRSYELRRAGAALKLERIPLEILLLLVEQRGQLVSREQIVDRVWGPGAFLDTDNSINGAIRKIRQVLKDDCEQPRYLQTITGKGYRFIAPVVESGVATSEQPVASLVSMPQSLIGRKISNYRIMGLLGGGGMGVVYRAEDLKLGRRVAIKFLPGEMASDPRAFERFEREARAASALDHRNICSIYQFGEHEGQPFIVMQLLEGRTLREWIEETAGRMDAKRLQEFLDLAIQIADGLEAAHQKGIIHRDIKPANIYVTNRHEAKILDFGVAKFMEASDSPAEGSGTLPDGAAQENPALTLTGASMGTPFYLSPEQIRGWKLDTRTDLFSFGLVLYEMATGQRAFAGKTATLIRNAVLSEHEVPARQLIPDLPPEMEAILAKALEKDRDLRFQSAGEMRIDLEQLRSAVRPVARRPWGNRLWLAGASAAVLMVTLLLYQTGVHRWRWPAPSTTESST